MKRYYYAHFCRLGANTVFSYKARIRSYNPAKNRARIGCYKSRIQQLSTKNILTIKRPAIWQVFSYALFYCATSHLSLAPCGSRDAQKYLLFLKV